MSSPFLAKWTGSVLASYELRPHSFVGLNLTSASQRNVTSDYQQSVPLVNRRPENANGYARLDFFTNIQVRGGLDLRVTLSNALNRKIYTPPFDNATGYDSQWAGRMARIGLTYSF